MLPDISKGRRLFGFDKKKYIEAKLKEALKNKDPDGFTTNNAVDLVKSINTYLPRSGETAGQLIAAARFYDMITDGSFDGHDDDWCKLYQRQDVKDLAYKLRGNIWKVITGLLKQRAIAKSMKWTIKENRINADWEKAFKYELRTLNDRVTYLNSFSIPKLTDFVPTSLIFKKDRIGSFTKYMFSLSDWDDEEKKYTKADQERFKADIFDTMESISDEEKAEWVKILEDRINEHAGRYIKIEKEIKAQRIEENKKVKDRVRDDLISYCGAVQKIYDNSSRNIEQRRSINANQYEYYVIVAARVSKSKTQTPLMYGRGGKQMSLTKDFGHAGIFSSYDEAKRKMAAITANSDVLAEIANIRTA